MIYGLMGRAHAALAAERGQGTVEVRQRLPLPSVQVGFDLMLQDSASPALSATEEP